MGFARVTGAFLGRRAGLIVASMKNLERNYLRLALMLAAAALVLWAVRLRAVTIVKEECH